MNNESEMIRLCMIAISTVKS